MKRPLRHGPQCMCFSNSWLPRTAYFNRRALTSHSGDASQSPPHTDSAFEVVAASVRFGSGVTHDVGHDIRALGGRKTLVVTDARVASLPALLHVEDSLRRAGVRADVFQDTSVEPTDASFRAAGEFAARGGYDSFVALGGGSAMDTAKAANLLASFPQHSLLDFTNPPIGKGLAPPGALKPLVAIPTTSGTGSEVTGVAIYDFEEMHAKTGIAHRSLKPSLALVDPDNTLSLPPTVTAASGFDVLCHSLESYTALPYTSRPRPADPSQRPTYQGSNPWSDHWSLKSLELCAKWLPVAWAHPDNEEARRQMSLAATYAGLGFGNAGVQLPHGMSYAVSGGVRDYRARDYPTDKPIIPHGMSVVLNAPAVFEYTGSAAPERHRECAVRMGADPRSKALDKEPGAVLAERVRMLMREVDFPIGLREVGFTPDDVPSLVQATLPQHRVIKLAPRPTGEKELTSLFHNAM